MANANRLIRPKWELYHTQNNPEHNLFEDYIVEFTDISGIVVHYYIRDNSIEMDDLYGETTETRYLDPIETKLIYDVTEETTMTNPFGIISEDVIQYGFIPKFTFSRDVSAGCDPKPGDVIKTLWNDRNYEIVDVGEEEKIFQLKKMIWELILKPYRFSTQSTSAREILISPDDLLSSPVSAYGDNEFIDSESDDIDDYTGSTGGDSVDEDIYGF